MGLADDITYFALRFRVSREQVECMIDGHAKTVLEHSTLAMVCSRCGKEIRKVVKK